MSPALPEDVRKAQGKDFAAKRKAKGHTQETLGEAFGVVRETIAEWERGIKQEVPKIAWLALDAVEPRQKKVRNNYKKTLQYL